MNLSGVMGGGGGGIGVLVVKVSCPGRLAGCEIAMQGTGVMVSISACCGFICELDATLLIEYNPLSSAALEADQDVEDDNG